MLFQCVIEYPNKLFVYEAQAIQKKTLREQQKKVQVKKSVR